MLMAQITLTAALRSNLLSLQGTQKLLDQTQLRLATGKKVNSALDNPSAFFTSAALTDRAGDLSNLLDGMGQAIQTLTAANNGITSLTSLVSQAQSIAQTANDSVSQSGYARTGDFKAANVADITTAGTAFAAGNNVLLNYGGAAGATVTVTVTANMSLAGFAAAINAFTGFSAQVVEGTYGTTAGTKRLEIRATNGQSLAITDVTAGFVVKLQTKTDALGVNGNDGAGAALATAGVIASTANSTEGTNSEVRYQGIRAQIDALITDTGYRGTNLLNGDNMTTQFNEKNTSKQTINGVTFNSTGLGISAANFRTQALITGALTEVSSGLTTLRAQSASFGNALNVIQTRQDFTSNLVNILKEGSDKLTLADKNEEGANLLSLQTAQQLGIQALSLASQANQSVLRLFQ